MPKIEQRNGEGSKSSLKSNTSGNRRITAFCSGVALLPRALNVAKCIALLFELEIFELPVDSGEVVTGACPQQRHHRPHFRSEIYRCRSVRCSTQAGHRLAQEGYCNCARTCTRVQPSGAVSKMEAFFPVRSRKSPSKSPTRQRAIHSADSGTIGRHRIRSASRQPLPGSQTSNCLFSRFNLLSMSCRLFDFFFCSFSVAHCLLLECASADVDASYRSIVSRWPRWG